MRSDKRPLDLEKKSLMMAGHMLSMLGVRNGYKMAKEILDSGLAYKKMRDIIRMQRGNPYIKPEDIKIGKYNFSFRAKKPGIIGCINNYSISKIARIAGAPVDKSAGIFLYKHVGENVNNGDILFTVYSESKEKLSYAEEIINEIEVVSVKEGQNSLRRGAKSPRTLVKCC
jgi:AMP phosphorylase